MHAGRTVFSQILDFMPRYEFNKCVQRYQGNYRIRKFSCSDQFLCMDLQGILFSYGLLIALGSIVFAFYYDSDAFPPAPSFFFTGPMLL